MDRAFVLTISDGVAAGVREDDSGRVLAERLAELGFEVERGAVPDDPAALVGAVRDAAARCRLVLTSGGTGLGPRDTTPQTLRVILDYDVPGFGEVMRAEGRRSTPLADLSRSFAGVISSTLVVAVPGSPRGALESLSAIEQLLEHALETLVGRTQAHPEPNDEAAAQASAHARGHDRARHDH